MLNGNIIQTSTDAVLGGGINGRLEALKQDQMFDLSEDLADIRENIEQIKAEAEMQSPSPEAIAENAAIEIDGTACATSARLAGLSQKIQKAMRYLTAYQLKHNIDWLSFSAKPVEGLMFLLLMLIIDGVAIAGFFLSGGFVAGISQALSLGLSISSVNILFSAGLGGFVFGRYWNYGLKSREHDPVMRHKRWSARVACIITAGAIVFLHMASGIVRATGETEGLSFGLKDLGVAATDFHSLMLWGIGAGFSVLAWRKGLSAFTDVYPGLSEASRSVNYISEEAQEEMSAALDQVDDTYDVAVEQLSDLFDNIKDSKQQLLNDMRNARNQCENLHQAISHSVIGFEAQRAEQIAFYQLVNGNTPDGHDKVYFDGQSLREQIPDTSIDISGFAAGFAETHKLALSKLSQSRKTAIEKLHNAYGQFLQQPKG